MSGNNKLRPNRKKIHKFKRFRQKFDISQVELATALGCSQAFICNIEKGHSKAPKNILKKFKKLKAEFEEQNES